MNDWERSIGRIVGTFGQLRGHNTMKPMRWFLCFGNLLRLLRDGKIKNDGDIDMGVFYEDCQPHLIENSFTAAGLTIKRKIINDADGKPLYYSLVDPMTDVHCCVFAWIKHKNIRYHTYDVLHEKKERPSKYIFKGVPAEYLEGELIDKPLEKFYRSVKIPLRYGALFDIWYPDWAEKRKGTSQTKWEIHMKSCKSLENESYESIETKWNGEKWKNGIKV